MRNIEGAGGIILSSMDSTVQRKKTYIEKLGLETVPKSLRTSTTFDYIKIQMAVSINAGNFLVPALAVLEGGLTFLQAVAVTVIGAWVAFFFVSLLALPGAVYGLPAQYAIRTILGMKGAMWLSSPVRTLTSLYWFSVQTIAGTYMVKEIFSRAFGLEISFIYISITLALIMAYLALVGFAAMKKLTSYFAPLLLISGGVMFYIYIFSGNTGGISWSEVMGQEGTGSIGTMLFFASLAFVQYVSGVSSSSDLARYGKTPSAAFVGIYIGNGAGFLCTAILGAYTASAAGHWNPFLVTSQMTNSFVLLLIISSAAIASMISININNAYTGGFSLLNSFPKLGRVKSALIFGAAGVLLSTYPGVVDEAEGFISLLGVFVIPLSAVIVSDFWFIKKRKLSESDFTMLVDSRKPININAVYAIVGGIIVYTMIPSQYSPGFITFFLTIIAYYYIVKLSKVRV